VTSTNFRTIANSIQASAQETISAMEANATAVAEGSAMMEEVERTLQEIQTGAKQMIELSRRIGESVIKRAREAEEITQASLKVVESTRENSVALESAESGVVVLNTMAKDLAARIEQIRVSA